MISTEVARFIVGIFGNIISLGLFLSPLPTMMKIRKAKSIQQYKPDPYLATMFNCAMWVFYGSPQVQPGSFLVLSINAVGLLIESAYLALFVYYGTWAVRKKITIVVLIEAVIFGGVLAITLNVWYSTTPRSTFVGILCIILNIVMYISPLTVMHMVIKTKSVKYMPLLLSVANLMNAGIWVAYALLKFDINILLPNGLGLLAALGQLGLYAFYYRTTDWDDAKVPEVQLPVTKTQTNPS